MRTLHVIILSVFVVTVLVWNGCKTTPPVVPPDSEIYQTTSITSDLDSTMIYIDDASTGKYAPQTVLMTPGSHTVTMKRAGFTDISKTVLAVKGARADVGFVFPTRAVLMEDFANVSCAPCVLSNILVEKLKDEVYNDSKLVVIKFATNFPSPQDPFYLAIPQICQARKNFYSVTVAPTLRIDGETRIVSPDSFNIKSAIQRKLAVPKQFGISMTNFQRNGTTVTLNAQITCLNTAGVDFANLVVHFVVIERIVEFPTPPGNNGETKFYNVVRAQLPDQNGQELGVMTPNQTKAFTVNSPQVTGWQSGNIEGVVFIQNKTTKEVYNAAYVRQLVMPKVK